MAARPVTSSVAVNRPVTTQPAVVVSSPAAVVPGTPARGATTNAVVSPPVAVTSPAAAVTTAAPVAATTPAPAAVTSTTPSSRIVTSTSSSATPLVSQVVPNAAPGDASTSSSSSTASSSSSSNSSFPVAAIAVIAIVGGVVALFAAYRLYLWLWNRKASTAPLPAVRGKPGFLGSGPGAPGSGTTMPMLFSNDPSRSAPSSRPASAHLDSVGGGGSSFALNEKDDKEALSSPGTPPITPNGFTTPGGTPLSHIKDHSTLSTDTLRQLSRASFAAPTMSSRSSMIGGVPGGSGGSQFGAGRRSVHSAYGTLPSQWGTSSSLTPPVPGGTRRLSGSPHSPHSRIEIIPPLPLAPPPSSVVATDSSTLDFSPISGIGRGGGGNESPKDRLAEWLAPGHSENGGSGSHHHQQQQYGVSNPNPSFRPDYSRVDLSPPLPPTKTPPPSTNQTQQGFRTGGRQPSAAATYASSSAAAVAATYGSSTVSSPASSRAGGPFRDPSVSSRQASPSGFHGGNVGGGGGGGGPFRDPSSDSSNGNWGEGAGAGGTSFENGNGEGEYGDRLGRGDSEEEIAAANFAAAAAAGVGGGSGGGPATAMTGGKIAPYPVHALPLPNSPLEKLQMKMAEEAKKEGKKKIDAAAAGRKDVQEGAVGGGHGREESVGNQSSGGWTVRSDAQMEERYRPPNVHLDDVLGGRDTLERKGT